MKAAGHRNPDEDRGMDTHTAKISINRHINLDPNSPKPTKPANI